MVTPRLGASTLFAAAATLASTALAQTPDAAESSQPLLVLDPGEHPLEALINQAASVLGHTWSYSNLELANSASHAITLQTPMRLRGHQIEVAISQLAFSVGFVMVPTNDDGTDFEWIAIQGPRRNEVLTRLLDCSPRQVLADREWMVPVQTTVPLRHTNPILAQNVLRPFLGVAIAPLQLEVRPVNGGIVLSGLAPQVARAVDLLQGIEASTVPKLQALAALGYAGTPPRPAESWRQRIERRLDALEREMAGETPATEKR